MPGLDDLVARIARHGPVPFSVYQEVALYGSDGFYGSVRSASTESAGGRGSGAGRHRDFLTSPEVGPLFGAVMASALDTWWDELDRPDPYVVVECGAGPATLARTVLRAAPRCAAALRYLLVDRSPAMQHEQRVGLPIVDAVELFGAHHLHDDDIGFVEVPGQGPMVCVLDQLPDLSGRAGVVVANELLDNCVIDIMERAQDAWGEIRVDHRAGEFVATRVPASADLEALARRLAPNAPIGARIPVAVGASAWLRNVFSSVSWGRLVVIDYGRSTAELAATDRQSPWLRTYREHTRGLDPFAEPGRADITSDVPWDQLFSIRQPLLDRPQAEFLAAHGIADLVAEGRDRWNQHVHAPTVWAVEGRSRIGEQAALCDPNGLGGFRVIEWSL